MIRFFLKAKHWQMFLLFILGAAVPSLVIFLLERQGALPPNSPVELARRPEQVFMVLPGFLMILAWLYAIPKGLESFLPPASGVDLRTYKIIFQIVLWGTLLVFAVRYYVTRSLLEAETAGQAITAMPLMGVLMLLQFAHFIGIGYLAAMAAKSLKTAEFQREVSFSGYGKEFVLTLFFPIGIWSIQNRLNRLVAGLDSGEKERVPSAFGPSQILGKRIVDVWEELNQPEPGMTTSSLTLQLDNGCFIWFVPSSGIDREDWSTKPPQKAKSLRATGSSASVMGRLRETANPYSNRLHQVIGQRIVDILVLDDEVQQENGWVYDRVAFELANDRVIAQWSIAFEGLGPAGLHIFENVEAWSNGDPYLSFLEERRGE